MIIFYTKSAEHLSLSFDSAQDRDTFCKQNTRDEWNDCVRPVRPSQQQCKAKEICNELWRSRQRSRGVKSLFEFGKFIRKQFCDGELYIKLEQEVKNQEVWVVSSTQSPAENLIELFFLLDALKRNGAKINLFLTYFAYARQDRIIEAGEALSSEIICNFLKQFNLKKILILHQHSEILHNYLNFESIIPYELYIPIAQNFDAIVAPDHGAKSICEKIARDSKKDFAWLEKFRPEQEKTEILKINGNVKNKNVLIIDDLISTGNTTINAADFLIKSGAKKVGVIVTHGIFCDDAVEKLEKSIIEKVYVTNSLEIKTKSKKIEIIDLSEFILKKLSFF